MMAEIETIIEEIRRRGEEEAEKVIREAREEAERIVEEARRRAEEIIESEARPEIVTMRRRILGTAELEGRRELLRAKEKILSKVMEKVRERLEAIVSGKSREVDYRQILRKLLVEAVRAVGGSEVHIYANKRDLEYLRKVLNKLSKSISEELGYEVKLVLSSEPIECMGGIVASSPDGTKTYYNTLDGKLSDAVKRFRRSLGRMLFREVLET